MPTFNVDSPDLRQLYLDLKAADGNLQILLRRAIKDAAQSVADAAKAGSAWSRRIPGAVKLKVSFTQRSTGVSVEVDGKKAPHARPMDHGGKAGTFRHPVFGTDAQIRAGNARRKITGARYRHGADWTWVEQPARPFFASAVDAKDPEIEKRILQVADELTRQAGFTN